jgi:hypothetical protein
MRAKKLYGYIALSVVIISVPVALLLLPEGAPDKPISPTTNTSVTTATAPDFSVCADTLVTTSGTFCAIAPSKTDAQISDISPDKGQKKDGFGYHVVAIPNADIEQKGVWVHFSGSGGRSYDQDSKKYNEELWLTELMAEGYVVLQLAYDNSQSVNGGLCGPDTDGNTRDNCAGEVRELALTGTGYSPFRTTTTYNSIDYRLKTLLSYLTQKTNFNLGTDLDPNNIDWSKISVSGHSQGGSQAYYIAKKRLVASACLLSSGYDYPDTVNPGPVAIADWFTTGTSMTPVSRIGAVIATTDERYENFLVGLTNVIGLPADQVLIAREPEYKNTSGKNTGGHNAPNKAPALKAERARACFR